MSTEKDKTETGSLDGPVLFGPSNDPRLSEKIDRLTGEALDSAIARLETVSTTLFDDEEGEDPFPEGITTATSALDLSGSDPEEDGLDQILDKLSAPSEDVDDEVRSLRDIALIREAEMPVPDPQRSPIADVLAGVRETTNISETGYHDPGLPDHAGDGFGREETDEELYDPLDDLGLFSEGDETEADDGTLEPDPDFPDEATEGENVRDDIEAEKTGAWGDTSYGLPEPTPYGDQMMTVDDEPDHGVPEETVDVAEDTTSSFPVTDERVFAPAEAPIANRASGFFRSHGMTRNDPSSDGSALEDLMTDLVSTSEKGALPDESASDLVENAHDAPRRAGPLAFLRLGLDGKPVSGVLSTSGPAALPSPEDDTEPSTPDSGASVDPGDPAAGTSEGGHDAPLRAGLFAFLRRGVGNRPVDTPLDDLGPLTRPAAEEGGASPAGFVNGDLENPNTETQETGETSQRSGHKRKLASVAAIALLAAAGVGFYLMKPDLPGQSRVVETPAPVFSPRPDTAETPASGTDLALAETSPVEEGPTLIVPPTFERVERGPLEGLDSPFLSDPTSEAPAGEIESPVPVTTDPGVPIPMEVSDLLAELNREPEPPVVVGVSPEDFEALASRLEVVERARSEAEERAARLSDELTGLTDQITGLLQRDSEQADRIERMERLIRGQSAILAQFGQMEESLEQTQVVLLDVSARLGAVEGQNPADRDAVNRALADVEDRLRALTANMSIIARMSIEGVDALRAPNASSGAVGVQTAPATRDASSGSNTVFRSEPGEFRISSDPAGRIPADVKKDDFIEGYGYVLDVLPASDGQRLVIMENGSVLVPASN